FFSSRRRHTRSKRDWSSDVCSSDLYFTGIVWEIHDRKGELRAIAGGGRYDNLIKLVSGVDLPALGFGMGDVVLGELLKDRGLLRSEERRVGKGGRIGGGAGREKERM